MQQQQITVTFSVEEVQCVVAALIASEPVLRRQVTSEALRKILQATVNNNPLERAQS